MAQHYLHHAGRYVLDCQQFLHFSTDTRPPGGAFSSDQLLRREGIVSSTTVVFCGLLSYNYLLNVICMEQRDSSRGKQS
ncbi:hypothetical protein MHYP_G00147210 [Metynnis hypsauchen]